MDNPETLTRRVWRYQRGNKRYTRWKKIQQK